MWPGNLAGGYKVDISGGGWRSRIVGHGEASPGELTANPRNWRKHPKAQRDALAAVLDRVGWVQDVIVNKTTGHLVDGHARLDLARQRGEASVPVVYVELDADEEALVLATLDPLAAMAEADTDALADLLAAIASEDAALTSMLDALAKAEGIEPVDTSSEYTQKIITPLYEPTGSMPSIADLFDTTVTDMLLDEIAAAGLPGDVRDFLRSAAQRHTVLRFDRIANYYAHAEPDVQRLMEASALVIVDTKQAVERGFLKLHENVMAAFNDENPNA